MNLHSCPLRLFRRLRFVAGCILISAPWWNVHASPSVNGISLGAGVGKSGDDFSSMRFGGFVNFGVPVATSEFRVEASHYAFPIAGGTLRVITLEAAFHVGGFPRTRSQRVVFMFMGGGLSANAVSGGKYGPKTQLKAGVGLNLGAGFFLTRTLSIYGEYAAKGIFIDRDGLGWGGFRLGLRYQSVH